MGSREVVLARIRQAVAADVDPVAVPRDYRRRGALAPGSEDVIDLLVERLLDYRAEVQHVAPGDLAEAIDHALAGATSVAIAADLPDDVRAGVTMDGRRVLIDGRPAFLSASELDDVDAVLTTASVAVADNGTIVLDGGAGQGRRIISLIPDLHVIVLRPAQVVHLLPEALARMDGRRPTTLIAGPSATSDIELSRVEGVHGPRTLRVLILHDGGRRDDGSPS
jgi:L-lactate dehydrogenase complex protein LldG